MDRTLHPGAKSSALLLMLALVACSAKPPQASPSASPSTSPSAPDSVGPAEPAPANPAAVPDAPADAQLSPAMRLMKQLDRDGDGRLSRAEHAFRSEQSFNAMDTDHDGKVTVQEMDAVRQGLYGENRSASSAAIAVGDSNRDGVLSFAEHAESTRVAFERMDTDNDSYLTLAELEAASGAASPAGR